MSVIYLVLPLALMIVALAVWAFVAATSRGQFDDLDTPAIRVLHDDDPGVAGRGAPFPPDAAAGRAGHTVDNVADSR